MTWGTVWPLVFQTSMWAGGPSCKVGMLWPHLPWLDKAAASMRCIDYPSFSRCLEPPLFLQGPHMSDPAAEGLLWIPAQHMLCAPPHFAAHSGLVH